MTTPEMIFVVILFAVVFTCIGIMFGQRTFVQYVLNKQISSAAMQRRGFTIREHMFLKFALGVLLYSEATRQEAEAAENFQIEFQGMPNYLAQHDHEYVTLMFDELAAVETMLRKYDLFTNQLHRTTDFNERELSIKNFKAAMTVIAKEVRQSKEKRESIVLKNQINFINKGTRSFLEG